jgi:hypothetical protein
MPPSSGRENSMLSANVGELSMLSIGAGHCMVAHVRTQWL